VADLTSLTPRPESVPCECCGEACTGEILYHPLHGGLYPLCTDCSWRFGNLCDMVRYAKRIPTFQDCMRRLRKGALEVHAVLPKSRAEYQRLLEFWLRTHPGEAAKIWRGEHAQNP